MGASNAEIILSVVVLPAPFGPSSPVMAPSGAVKETSRTAAMAPNCLPSALASIIG